MKKLAAIVTLTSLMLTGCLTGQNPTPQVAPHISGAAAAFTAYCSVASETDAEVQRICQTYVPVAATVAGAAETAMNLIFGLMTKREVQARQLERSVECHK